MTTFGPDARPVNRARGEGPPACCARAVVAADELLFWGALPADTLAAIRAAAPQWAGIPDSALYLCGACRERFFRHKLLTREAHARGLGLAPVLIALAWVHDEEFWHRGPPSAPAEVKAQPWWPAYQQIANGPPGQAAGAIQALLRQSASPT